MVTGQQALHHYRECSTEAERLRAKFRALGDKIEAVGEGVRSGVILKRPLNETGLNSSPISPSLPPVVAPDAGALRPEPSESMVLAWKQRPIAVPKKKDVSKGRPFKINVYQDDSGAGVSRAKVDLDRDDQWDHKYTFEPDGGVTRKVSPNDDENYTVVQRLTDAEWITQE